MSSHLHAQGSLPDPPDQGVAQPPVTATERALAEIWCEVLEVSQVGIEDNFFDLGGHSVLLHMIQDRIGRQLGKTPPLIDLFTFPTVRTLARRLDGDQPDDTPPVSRTIAERAGSRARLERQRARRSLSSDRAERGETRE
ncbi:phosphopantetheine-binding protein [Streptomyces shenzhenensis]|uniref:phosphopantetheine-binding protein n=1 Tax=Streptomyces shenzhenensis TaxID=943815 RepID=UPI00367C23ED